MEAHTGSDEFEGMDVDERDLVQLLEDIERNERPTSVQPVTGNPETGSEVPMEADEVSAGSAAMEPEAKRPAAPDPEGPLLETISTMARTLLSHMQQNATSADKGEDVPIPPGTTGDTGAWQTSPGYLHAATLQDLIRDACHMNSGPYAHQIRVKRDLTIKPYDPTCVVTPVNKVTKNFAQVLRSIKPTAHYHKRTEVWDSRIYGVKQKCIGCGEDHAIGGYTAPSNPVVRFVYGESDGRTDGNYFLHTFEVNCNKSLGGCGKSFLLTNEKAVALLPPHAQRRFPAYLTEKAGVDKAVIQKGLILLAHGVGPNRQAQMELELGAQAYDSSKADYYQTAGALINEMAKLGGIDLDTLAEAGPMVPKFSDFGDRTGYCGRSPSGWF